MPMVLPAPGRVSTMIGWPSCADSWSATMRPMTSLALPAVSGTMMRTGFDGQGGEEACEEASVQVPPTTASTVPTAMNQPRIVILLECGFSARPSLKTPYWARPISLRRGGGPLDQTLTLGPKSAVEKAQFAPIFVVRPALSA